MKKGGGLRKELKGVLLLLLPSVLLPEKAEFLFYEAFCGFSLHAKVDSVTFGHCLGLYCQYVCAYWIVIAKNR